MILKEDVKSIAKEMIAFMRSDLGYTHKRDPIVYFADAERYGTCSGGMRNDKKPFIFIARGHFCKHGTHLEYDHIQEDPDIGGFTGASSKKCINAIVAHELAHVLSYTVKKVKIGKSFNGYMSTNKDDMLHHGIKWQYFYSILRKKFVNHLS